MHAEIDKLTFALSQSAVKRLFTLVWSRCASTLKGDLTKAKATGVLQQGFCNSTNNNQEDAAARYTQYVYRISNAAEKAITLTMWPTIDSSCGTCAWCPHSLAALPIWQPLSLGCYRKVQGC